MQQARRTNPYPWTWEIPAAALLVFMLAMVMAAHLARTLANLLAGHGWELVARAELFSSIPDLFAGDASAGLKSGSTHLASSTELLAWIAGLEFTLILVAVGSLAWGLARWGPGRIIGMASARDVDRLLGVARLRRNASVIRPDLYGGRAE